MHIYLQQKVFPCEACAIGLPQISQQLLCKRHEMLLEFYIRGRGAVILGMPHLSESGGLPRLYPAQLSPSWQKP